MTLRLIPRTDDPIDVTSSVFEELGILIPKDQRRSPTIVCPAFRLEGYWKEQENEKNEGTKLAIRESTLSASNSNVEDGTDFGLVGRTGDPLLFDF